jgi:hypothetical protein
LCWETEWCHVDFTAYGSICPEAAGVNFLPLVLGETAPDSIGLTNGKSVLGALHLDRAGSTDRLGGGVSINSSWAAFTFGVEERVGVFATTKTD